MIFTGVRKTQKQMTALELEHEAAAQEERDAYALPQDNGIAIQRARTRLNAAADALNASADAVVQERTEEPRPTSRTLWVVVERVEQCSHDGSAARDRILADLAAMKTADPTRDLVVQQVEEVVLTGERYVLKTIGDPEHYQKKARAREELCRLDAAWQEASKAHDVAVEHVREAEEAVIAHPERVVPGLRLGFLTHDVQEARLVDSCAHHAFEAARRMAESLGFVEAGEREFYSPPDKPSRAAMVLRYAEHVFRSALRSSGDDSRARISRTEALAQGYGDYGPHGTAVFEAWLKEQQP
jgi:hypothetical protein